MSERIELLLKAGGLIAAFGYVSFRAHANYLGLWPNADPSYTLCLTEGYPLLAKLISVCIAAAIWALILTGVVIGLGHLLDRNPSRFENFQRELGKWAQRVSPTFILVSMFLLLLASSRLVNYHDEKDYYVMVGELNVDRIGCLLPDEPSNEAIHNPTDKPAAKPTCHCARVFNALAGAAVYGWLCIWVMSRYPTIFTIRSYSIRPLCIAMLLAQALNLALIYGREQEGCNFRVVDVKEGKDTHEGILIGIGDSGISVWNMNQLQPGKSEGQITIYQKDHVVLQIKGPVDIRQYALNNL